MLVVLDAIHETHQNYMNESKLVHMNEYLIYEYNDASENIWNRMMEMELPGKRVIGRPECKIEEDKVILT